ncbi:MAG: TlyA family RNA methyltransferase [Clostridia bacterium]|nr:TlyA family RNA methyltransferase [Clostridia bacterium]
MRADVFLFRTGVCASRTAAAQIIKRGNAVIDGKTVKRPSDEICAEDAEWDDKTLALHRLRVSVPEERFVGRGGYKLEAALDGFGIDVSGLVCCDIGASTGGFTDCLLQRGAGTVFAVDVGHGQLAEKLKSDVRVVSVEGFNARELTSGFLGTKPDIAVCDVSFISQRMIYGAVAKTLREGGYLISLIKPQFEVGRLHIKNGIVNDKKLHVSAVAGLCEEARRNGLAIQALIRSPIKGGDGNTEYLALFLFDPSAEEKLTLYDVIDVVYEK